MGAYTSAAGAVPRTTLWRIVSGAAESPMHRVIPDAVMDLVWSRGQLLFAGPDTEASLVPSHPGAVTWGLRLDAGVARALLGVAAGELRDQRVMLREVAPIPRALLDLAHRDPRAALDGIAAELWRRAAPEPAALDLARAVDRAARAGADVRTMAEQHGFSERGLRRYSAEVFGYGPKTLASIHRLQRALRIARAGASAADAAALAGYADQAHLSREAKRLAGTTFGALTAG